MFYEHFVKFDASKSSGSQQYAICPFHNDTDASFTVNSETDEWYCHACQKGGTPVQFIEEYYDVEKKIAEYAYSLFQDTDKFPFPTEEQVEKYQEQLKKMPRYLDHLHEFGITDEVIEHFQLGYNDLRIIFPIKGKTGRWVNLRKYLPTQERSGASANTPKMIQTRGLGSKRYYPYEAFDDKYNEIFIVEGEKDCLVARSQGLNAVTNTAGSNIPTQEIYLFADKIVYLMLDTDAAGTRTTKQYIQLLRTVAKEVHQIVLPAKDFTEYFMSSRDTDVKQYEVQVKGLDVNKHSDDACVTNVSLGKSEYVENLNSWVRLENMSVVGTDPKTFTVPKKLKAVCRDMHCTKPCALGMGNDNAIVDVDPRQLLQFVSSSDMAQDTYLRKLFGCKSIISEPAEYTNVQQLLFQETASFVDGLEESTFEHRYGIYLYEEGRLLPTTRYNFEACRVTDPRSQMNYYVIREATPVTDGLDKSTNIDIGYFSAIASGATSFRDFIAEHYKLWLADLGIEGRPDLFAAIALTYLSVTEIEWKGGKLKGWLDTMCIGDTRTGKSQMAQRFVKTLSKGAYINGENARRTGVIGGVQRLGDSWVITWGAIPMNDKGLLVIDEASGLEVEDVKELSATRSSGAITINKIAKGEAKARTRLIWLSNPRSGRNIEDFYWKGYGAFQEYIPVVEDQARYDLVLTAAREDVTKLNGIDSVSKVPKEKWKTLINFAWNVPAEDIIISQATKDAINKQCEILDESYGGGPLVVGVAVHEKVLRISCAIAVLCGSIKNNQLIVEPKHTEWATEMLQWTYDKPTMDYKGYIQEYKKAQRRKTENNAFIRTLCAQNPALKILLSSNMFRGAQVREVLGIDSLEASKIISELLKRGLVRLSGSGAYVPDKMLIDIAKQMEVTL